MYFPGSPCENDINNVHSVICYTDALLFLSSNLFTLSVISVQIKKQMAYLMEYFFVIRIGYVVSIALLCVIGKF